ncbi:MAG: alpha/beta hydrolase [Candidatus Thiodiazotropha sp.]|uniref:Alpha/beta hydrolase family protein n=2 Tax=Candidatus Thiodiazotropha endolucinida TaxID=1655433 RepID=A0A7Z0VIP8_9GAMM|nr:alpha/beta hydrolase family protein [Candidatus Thiodiazotropha endolucinida]
MAKTKILLLSVTAFLSAAMLSFALAANDWRSKGEETTNQDIVVLLHGLGRSNTAMWLLAARIGNAGYQVEQVGYSSLNKAPEEIIGNISQQIDACCAEQDRTVHFVGHSLGGLLIRAYLQENKLEYLGRVVLVGTPNQGTEIVDNMRDNCLMQLLGPTANALGTDDTSLPKQLEPPYYPVGVIAGYYDSDSNDDLLPGRDDGLVPVESTKLEGMTDFIEIESGHSMMRYSKDVAKQVIAFLNNGKFHRE